MAEEYDIDMDPIIEGGSAGSYSNNLPKLLDPVMTVQVVQKFMDVERKRNRRALLWLSSIFFLVILMVLALFAGIGMHVLNNTTKAAHAANVLQAQNAVYASELPSMSNEIDKLYASSGQLEKLVRLKEDQRLREGRVLKTDLERFGRWVQSRTSSEKQTIAALMARLEELEAKVGKGGVPAARDVPVAAVPAEHVALAKPIKVEPVIESATVPEIAVDDIDGKFDVALAAPVRVAVPVAPLERGDVSVVSFPNGDRYKGAFKAGLFHGWGEYSYKNGDRYEGFYNNDLKSGKGTYVYASGDKYVGDFDNGMREGVGSMLFANGDKYIGEFTTDTLTGKGARFYDNGNKYSGDFKDGVKQGNGVLSYFNGDSYKGEFRDDLRNGRGLYVFSNGSKYIGDFKADKRHGSGRFIFSDGGEYIGAFKDGMKHGEGLCIYPDGRRLKGLWKEDRFVKVLE